jgi:glycerol kinase
MKKYILSIDQGTSSCRAILLDRNGIQVAIHQIPLLQYYPKPGWVEHDALEIWNSTLSCIQKCLESIEIEQVSSIGITNQRETVVAWDKTTGIPFMNAIVWQDKRTIDDCKMLQSKGLSSLTRQKTGLMIDPYFSATKIKWILDKLTENQKENLAIGTVDTWLLWKLTKGKSYFTDTTNASRTLLMNLETLTWDKEMSHIFGIPSEVLAGIRPSCSDFGVTQFSLGTSQKEIEIPIGSMIGDQQSALFGHQALKAGEGKNTYGTGCFLLLNAGHKVPSLMNGILNTLGWSFSENDEVTYAREGSVLMAGAVIQWLRDDIGLIKKSSDSELMAESVEDNGGVFFVPSFTGLGAPYWDMDAKGLLTGLSRGVNKNHIVRAALEGIAYQTLDLVNSMNEGGFDLTSLHVDGGACHNNFLMQFQADILDIPVIRPMNTETTAQGAAFLAGIGSGFWEFDELKEFYKIDKVFEPRMKESERQNLIQGWHGAISKTKLKN